MPSSSVFKEIEGLLEEVLQSIREEYEGPYSVLCETDRNHFVKEEESLRKELKETIESESNASQWRSWLGLASPRAVKCLESAKALRNRVKDDINAKLRTRFTGKSSPSSLAYHGQGSAFDPMGARTPETDAGHPFADANPEPARSIITSPLNMDCSGPSELIVYPPGQGDNDYTSGLNDAINTPLEMFSDQSSDPFSRPRRRPPPPTPRRMAQSNNPYLSSENSGSDSPRRSSSIRRPAPPLPRLPRQPRTPGSPTNGSFLSPNPFPPNPAMISVPEFTQQVDKLVASIVKQSLSQAQGRRGLRCNEDYITKTNCVDITGSNVDGVTLNNGGTKNSGAVIHKTILPPRSPQPVPQF